MRASAPLLAGVVVVAVLFGSDERRATADERPPDEVDVAPDVPMLEHAETVASYTLRAKLDPDAHTVHGEGTITWRNPATKPVAELWLHLYLNAFKNQSTVFMRAPVGGFRGTTVPKDWGTIDLRKLTLVDGEQRYDLLTLVELKRGGDEDETDARVPLPREVPPGATITLDVAWDDKLPSIVERTGYDGTFHMIAQWFPKVAKIEPDGTFAHFPFHHLGEFYADYGAYDVTIDAPESYLLGATGPAVEARVENGRRIERHVQDDIHDFAWTAWDKFHKRTEKIAGVDVAILFPPGYDDHAERELDTIRFALPHYGARYGRYPYPVLTLVHPPASAPEAGGMEYPTLITTGGGAWIPRGLYLPEIVTIHEFGHQYFYGLVATHEVAWPFLDEGLNSYAESEGMTAWKGPGSAADMLGIRLGGIEAHAERARHFAHDDKVAQPAYAFASGSTYGALVYSRTATILETLRRVWGDAKMRRAMGVYTRKFRFRHPTPDDLLAVVRAELGDGAGDALQTALFEEGWVDYAILSASSHESRPAGGIFDRNGKRETVPTDKRTPGRYDGSVLVARRGTLRIPVEVELVSVDGTRKRVPWDGQSANLRVPYTGSSPLRSVVVDPDHKVLLDEHPENNFVSSFGQSGGGASRTLERATFWAEVILGASAP